MNNDLVSSTLPTFVAVQATYTNLSIALFAQGVLTAQITLTDARASSHIVPQIDRLLFDHSIGMHEINFVAVDHGPGAFTSLRVAVATANGIAFGNGIPLIGVSGLEALAWQAAPQLADGAYVLCLLNAYNKDVYYGLYQKMGDQLQRVVPHGCAAVAQLPEQCPHVPALVVGNGTVQHKEACAQLYPEAVVVDDLLLPTAEQVGIIALRQWQTGYQPLYQLTPEYLKTQLFTIRR